MQMLLRFPPLKIINGIRLPKSIAALLAFQIFVLVLAWFASLFLYRIAIEDALRTAKQTNQVKLERMMEFVNSSFIQVAGIPQVLAFDTRLRNILQAENNDQVLADTNQLLDYFATRLGVDVVWLLNAQGICIASSNFQRPESFVGVDYSDRKYFLDAKHNKLGRQFAIGRKTKIPGLFFSAPIIVEGNFIGTVVLKSNLPQLTDKLLQPGTFIVDDLGVIILSHDSGLIFHTIPHASAMTDEDRLRQYSTTQHDPLIINSAGIGGFPDIIRINDAPTAAVIDSLNVPTNGLTLFSITEFPQIQQIAKNRIQMFIAISLAGLFFGVTLTVLHRWRNRFKLQLQQAENNVAALKSRYELILQSAGDGIIGIDPNQMISFANPACCRMLHQKREDLEGSPYQQALCGPLGDLAFPAFPLPPGQTAAQELTFIRPDGSTFTAEYIMAAIQIKSRFDGATLVFRDISLRKQYEQNITTHQLELERQVIERTQTILSEIKRRNQSEQAMKAAQSQALQAAKLASVGQLAAGIAHEINTPTQYIGDNLRFIADSIPELTSALKLAVDVLQQTGSQITEQFQEQVDLAELNFLGTEIQTAATDSLQGIAQVARIVLSMKEFSHPGTHHKVTTDINHALESTLTVSRNVWKNIAEINQDFNPDLPKIQCMAGEINQVFLNLIVNAAQAIEESGKPYPGHIGIKTHYDAQHVIISISDDGAGIPDAIREKIYDPFFTTKAVGKGTGQGLAICYDVVVNKHGGSIDLESQPGVGTTFTIRLPSGNDDDTEQTHSKPVPS